MPAGAAAVGGSRVPGRDPLPAGLKLLLLGGNIPPVYVCMAFWQNYNRPIGGLVPAATVLMRARSWMGDFGKLACRKLPWSHDLTCYCAA